MLGVELTDFTEDASRRAPSPLLTALTVIAGGKPNSNWSAKNREHAIRLIAEGRMAPAGLAHVEATKADGRWESAYAGSATMIMPQDFLDALEAMPAAKAFFQTLDRKNLYPIYYRLHTAKRPETRAKRLAQILAQLDRGERFH